MLPEQFLNRMKQMLGEEYPLFLESYEKTSNRSLRVNHLKDPSEEVCGKVGFLEEPVLWAEGGFYYKEDTQPGKHPFHEAGVYYIQEASAMAPAEALMAKPGEKVLDLCAAPGGKSAQLADAMKGKGLLVCNEVHPGRAKILSENLERMGVTNGLVLNHEPSYLAEHFPGFFDKILVDAPCSGEGMFRKNPEAVQEWSIENVQMCADRQSDIMESAARMLKEGGLMVYSTCTFAPEEDEGTIGRFLKRHPEFSLKEVNRYPGMEPGRPEWVKGGGRELAKTVRLLPHKLKGEGHFMALLKKAGGEDGPAFGHTGEKGAAKQEYVLWTEFKENYLKKDFGGIYLKFGEQLYLAPGECPSLKGLKVLRAGLHLGTLKKNRFEPAHALALALKPQEAAKAWEVNREQAEKYLKGETFPAEGEKGWYLICMEGYSLGFGKLSGGMMKNHYPKGLRKNG
ncbi:MAG: RsmB/NOP family class I SAM-dependent RNA methyltransferase [Lachnospiraceae bacterium]|nr:RsmB/NOP family class I SAM-dependent RNA methyltransferase [Lachnospiraceae bacterium]